MSRIRVLGVDPGFANIGLFGITRLSPGVKAEFSRLILTEKGNEGSEGQYEDDLRRLELIEAEFVLALDDFKPDVVASERTPSLRNAQATRQIACAFGAMHAISRRRGLPFLIFHPEDIKFELCGSRKAKKPKLAKALKGIFPTFSDWPKAKKKATTTKHGGYSMITHVVDAGGAAILASKLDLDALLDQHPLRVTVTEVVLPQSGSPT